MLFKTLITALMICASVSSYAATPKEEKAKILKESIDLVYKYRGTADLAQLQKLDSYIERTWGRFTGAYGTSNKLAPDFAILRARGASASKRRKGVAQAWRDAIQLLPAKTTGSRRMNFFIQAAHASTDAKDFQAAKEFFAAARSLAAVRGENADKARLYLKLSELKSTGGAMEWRRLNDSLLDLRTYSQGFVMWSIPRLDALIGEAEIRLAMQPNRDNEKREILGALKANIILIQKGMNGAVPPMHVARIRTLFYALEDHFDL